MKPNLNEVKQLVIKEQRVSPSLLQRRLHITYAEAANFIEALELEGFVGVFNGSKPRKVLIKSNPSNTTEE